MKLSNPLILASNSPRRKQILADAGFDFTVKVKPTDEIFPETMPADQVPVFLAEQKAFCFKDKIQDEIILCADTVVIVDGEILNKPPNFEEAQAMLRKQSNKIQKVVTGVCLMTATQKISFADTTLVQFKELSEAEISYYIEKARPFDKAGAYGVQDFIGMVGINRLEGSFYTVMGLPIHRVYEVMKNKGWLYF